MKKLPKKIRQSHKRQKKSTEIMELQENVLIKGRYRLLEERGRGSFGEVWRARDEVTEAEVAVKIYIALDKQGLKEFTEEFRVANALNHPNLLHADYYDICENRPFIVMPYCPESAVSLVGKMDEGRAWKFLRDVSSGLSYLHGKDIVHRDIKPDNILRNEAAPGHQAGQHPSERGGGFRDNRFRHQP